ncbi:hypothetical protein SPLC1_S530880 [Arthrospira platensis C1]|nr:hypothetical protein SPLC1_S530880 [Arthrospira platensis C1]
MGEGFGVRAVFQRTRVGKIDAPYKCLLADWVLKK